MELSLLKESTFTLLDYTERMRSQYAKAKDGGIKGNFFEEVRPFANEVKEVNDKWREWARVFVKERKPRYINQNQIESAYDSIEMLSIQCFYPDTSRKRFVDQLKSVEFILTSILNQKDS
ncbi:YppE family protein [Cytobacillus sp. Hz8]|uniref:YppE family protein n=1 Tax=Cytobacillus sp. Hz8 TaxID=3347168 RepID=UPI0035DF86AE